MHQVNIVWSRQPCHARLAHVLLRKEVARACRVPLHEVRLAMLCAVCGSGKHGKPYVIPLGGIAPPHVSLSRAGDLAMVAWTHSGPVGVDVECAEGPSFAGFDEVVFHPDERAASVRDRARTWVRKESLLKATGDGLSVDPRDVRLGEPAAPPYLLEWAARPSLTGQLSMHDVDVGPDHVASVTVLGGDNPDINVRVAVPEDFPHEARPGRGPEEGDDCAPPQNP